MDQLISGAGPGCCMIVGLAAIAWMVFDGIFPYRRENREWRAFAAQHGLSLTGRHPRITLEGQWRGHLVTLNVHSHHHHRHSHHSQHFTLTLVPSIHDLVIGTREQIEQRGAPLSGQPFTTGDAAFDDRFRMQATDVAAARAWLDARRRGILLGAPPAVHVDYHGLRVIAAHVPVPRVVAEQFDMLAALADALR
jgi:hypothetical protein